MTLSEFRKTLSSASPPKDLLPVLCALWYAGKGDWHQAHGIAQDLSTREGSHVHAYLHRQEGDISNATYWYHRAGRKLPSQSLEDEWSAIVQELLTT